MILSVKDLQFQDNIKLASARSSIRKITNHYQ